MRRFLSVVVGIQAGIGVIVATLTPAILGGVGSLGMLVAWLVGCALAIAVGVKAKRWTHRRLAHAR
ncbi:MAG: hypothetical protein OXS50_10420 [Gammaproteobacteria bacterium]|nr:hypothetical protein [Gammaproteobacteria bacterium]